MSENPVVLGGRYEVGRLLGRGGMAEVHLATDRRLHRTVAVKILHSDLARDDTFLERFRREAQSAAGLNHPSIVAVYDTGEDHRIDAHGTETSIPYIVMEYVEGRTLRAFIHEGHPMDTRQAAEIMVGVLSALEYSHSKGIVHRDIKPGNIMITDDGAVKVMDFGIARAVADANSAMTQTQAVMGTAQYLSPEQARGQIVDSRSDIYSAACVLYEMLTGRPPFTGESPVSIAYQHVREDPVPPSTYNPRLTPAMDAVILTGLAKDRDERYPSAVSFSRDIAAVVAGRAPRLTSIVGLTPAPDRPENGSERTTVLAPMDPATELLGAPGTTVLPGAAAAGAYPGTGQIPAQASAYPGTGQIPAQAVATGSQPVVAEAEEERRKRPIWLFVLLGLALAAVVTALLLYFRPWDTAPDTVAVPSVVGKTEAQARTMLEGAGLSPQFTREASTEVPEGIVVKTEPTANTQVALNSKVAVTVSSGPGAVTVPDLAGKTTDEARAELEGLGLVMKVGGTEDSLERDAGQVTRSDPEASATANQGDTVTIWTATGNVAVPNVEGQSEKDAKKTLEAAGLTAEVTDAEDPTMDPGTVKSQNPPAGSSAAKGSAVQIVVVREAGPVTIPNLTGHTPAEAEQALKELGLGFTHREEASDAVPAGAVVGTDPAANQKVDPGTSVTIIISTGPTPTQDPTTTPAPTEDPTTTEPTQEPTTQDPTTTPAPTQDPTTTPAPASGGTGTERGNKTSSNGSAPGSNSGNGNGNG